jgi:Homing endonuclease
VPSFSEDDPGHSVNLPVSGSGGESFSKWAGEPGPGGGLAGSYIQPDSAADNYDPQKKPSPFVEVGAFGLAQYGGFIRDEFLLQLQGDAALKVYREMWDNSPVIGAIIFAIQMLLRKVEWRVEPPEAASVEEIVAERMAERQAAADEQQKAQSQQLMMAQAGLASKSPGSTGGAKPPGAGQPPIPQMGKSPLVSGADTQTPFHQPISGPGTSGNAPGANRPSPATLPGQGNQPQLTGASNSPGGNPSGSPAQAAGLSGEPGMGPGTGKQSSSQLAGPPKRPTNWLTKAFGDGDDDYVPSFTKAGPPSGGGGNGPAPVDPSDPGVDPTDSETNEPMEFPLGASPVDDSPAARQAEELAVFVETALHDLDLPWAEVISQIVTMVVYGWSFHEIVYKKRNGPNPDMPEQGSRFADGRVGWSKLAMRAQETRYRWEFDTNGNVLGFWQMAPPRFQIRYIPMSKGLLFRTSAYKNNPEGRALSLDTLIPTPNGWRTMADLDVGDPIFGSDGKVRYVTATQTWTDRPTYRITFSDGSTIDADAKHQWITSRVTNRDKFDMRTTEDLAAYTKTAAGSSVHSIEWAQPVEYSRQYHVVDPYVLGLWLGDGTTVTGSIATHVDDANELASFIEEAGFTTKVILNGKEDCLGRQIQVYDLTGGLRSIDVFGNKHIPESYLRGDTVQRRALLAGLMDSDGTIDHLGRCQFTNVNQNLISGCAELVRSLGMSCKVTLRKKADGIKHKQDSYAVTFTPKTTVFRLARKTGRLIDHHTRQRHYITAVEPVQNATTKCIEVDSPNHMYLVGESFIPTHNSCLRSAYVPYFFLKRIQEFEAIGIERDLAGMPVARVPYDMMTAGATPQQKSALEAIKKVVRNLRRNDQEGVVFPSYFDPETKQNLFDLTLLSAQGSARSFDTDTTITRYEQRMAMVVLADFILLGHDGTGTQSLGETKEDLFTSALEAFTQTIADVFNTFAFPRLLQMNGEDPAMCPRLTAGKLATVSLEELGQLLTAMSGAGAAMFPDTQLEDYLRERGSMPPKAASDDL